VEELKKIKPNGFTMAQFAIKWILMNDAVSCTIPGGRRPEQVVDNATASELADLDPETMRKWRKSIINTLGSLFIIYGDPTRAEKTLLTCIKLHENN